MKTTPPNESDTPLNELLQGWKVEPTLPPRFQERVWQRIAAAESAGAEPRGVLAWLSSWLARPGLAAGYVTALLVAGFVLGWTHGLEQSARMDANLRSRYIQELDPYRHAAQIP